MAFIGIDLQGYKQIRDALAKFPKEVQDIALDDVSEYVINVLRIYPPKKSITRRQAYGRTFQSERQRRYFFWALRNGIIRVPYSRTQTLSRSWKKIGTGTSSIIVNETPYAEHVMGERQSRMSNLIGWERLDAIPHQHRDKIEKVLFNSAHKALKKLGLRS